MIFALILCLAASLLPTFYSWRRMKDGYNESSLFLFIGALVYSFVFAYGVFVRLNMRDVRDEETLRQMFVFAGQVGFELEKMQLCLVVATIVFALMNAILGLIIYNSKRPITYSLAFVVGVVVASSVGVVVLSGSAPVSAFFYACCGIMAYFAYVLELTYKEFCVLGNIYLQSVVCLLASVSPVLVFLRTRSGSSQKKGRTLLFANFAFHGFIFFVVVSHYWMPLEAAFDLCYNELMWLASTTGTPYFFVNLMIFVVLFLGDLAFNSILYGVASKGAAPIMPPQPTRIMPDQPMGYDPLALEDEPPF